MISLVFLCLLVLSTAAYAISAGLAERLVRRFRRAAWHCFSPGVSIIKPLSGLDDDLEENLESFYRLDYPEYEVVFSFARRTDPAFEIARRVADRSPKVPTIFAVDAREPGVNSKVNRLAVGIARSRFRYLLMTDGNVRVDRGFLERAAGLFADRSVGLVSHLFVARGARSFASRLESLYLNGVLRPGTAAVAALTRMPCVVGKSILVSREALNAIGGIETLRDHLAEDFLLGKRISETGFRVLLSGDSVDTTEVSRSLRGSWSRQRRWAILRNRLGGAAYASELLCNPLPVCVGAAVTGQLEGALLLYAARVLLESASLASCRALRLADLFLFPIRDLSLVVLWFAGLIGRRTQWRGRLLSVGAKTVLLSRKTTGRLVQIPERN